MTLIKQKIILLIFLPCFIGLAFLNACGGSEDRGPVTEPEYPATEQPDRPLKEEAPLPGQPDSETADIETPPAQVNPAEEYGNVTRDFVNTIAGILSGDDIVITPRNIEELERVISVLAEAQKRIDADLSPAPDALSESQQRLADLRQELGIEPIEFSDLRIPSPEPAGDRYVILSGIWLREARLALRDLERHKEYGANNILITVPLDCDAELNFSTCSKEAIAMYVQAAHASGMSVSLTLCQGPPGGYSRGWHDAFFGEQVEVSGKAVLDALTPFVMEWAEFAAEYQVEIFMPVIEPIMWASMDTRYWEMDDQTAGEICGIVTEWMQALLPVIKERYSGRLMFATHNRVTGDSPYFQLDFSGYDYIANWESGEEIVTQLSQEYISTGTCQGLIHHVTLYVGGLEFEPAYVLTEEEQAIAYNEYFRHAWNNEATAGIMLDLGVGKDYIGRPAEEVIESWLADSPRVPSKNIDVLWSVDGLFDLLDKILSPTEVAYSDEWLEPPSHN